MHFIYKNKIYDTVIIQRMMAGMDTYCMKVRLSLEVNITDILYKLNIIIVNPRIKR